MKKKIFVLLSGSALLCASCAKKAEDVAIIKKGYTLTPTMEKMITIDTVKMARVQDELKMTGKVTFDEDKVIKVLPLVAGTVQDVKVELGDKVAKGQVLAVIQSGEVAGLVEERTSADAAVQIAKRNVEMTQEMLKSGVSSQKDLMVAQKEYEKAIAAQNRVRRIYNIYAVDSKGQYVIKSPISGYIVEKNINNLMQVRLDNTTALFTISGLDEVWVNANVFESDIDKIKEGYEADVSTLAYEGKVFRGKIDKIYNVLDSETKVLKARIKLPNPGVMLKPEMFASVDVHFDENRTLPAIPAEAVIFDNNKYYVMVYHRKDKIETRKVNIEKTVGGTAYIQFGLEPGEKIITKNKLLIYDDLND